MSKVGSTGKMLVALCLMESRDLVKYRSLTRAGSATNGREHINLAIKAQMRSADQDARSPAATDELAKKLVPVKVTFLKCCCFPDHAV